MTRTNATGRSTRAAKHVRVYRWMLTSPAYRSLGCYARCLLVELGARYNGDNNGHIPMSVREAAGLLGCSQPTACKAFLELEGKGFIRAHEKGAFHVKVRHSTTWILTEHPYAGQPATKDFMRWEAANA